MRKLILAFVLFAFLAPVLVPMTVSACPELTKYEKIAKKHYCKRVHQRMLNLFATTPSFPDDPNGLLNYLLEKRRWKGGRNYVKNFVDLVYKADVNTFEAFAEFASTNCMEGGRFLPPLSIRKNWSKIR